MARRLIGTYDKCRTVMGMLLVAAVTITAACDKQLNGQARTGLVALAGQERVISTFFSQLKGWAKQRPSTRPKLVVALDVDGTCADLDPDPKAVQLKPGLIREAKALQKAGVIIVFITGRSGNEIGGGAKQVYPELVEFQRYTDHGAIVRGAGKSAPSTPTNARVGASIRQLAAVRVALERAITAQLASAVGPVQAAKLLAGRFERKDLGLAVHWRGMSMETANQLERAAQRAWATLPKRQRLGFSFAVFGNVTQQTPLRDGIELRIDGVTKADAIRDLARRHRLPLDGRERLVFIGDSGTDENGFTALRGLFPEGSALGIRVDAKHDVKTSAHARLINPAAVLRFLSQLRKLIRF